MLSITGKPHQVKLSLGRSDFEVISIPLNPKQFDLNPELLLLLLESCYLGWQFHMLPDVSSNTIIGSLTNDLPNVNQGLVRDTLCQYIGKFCLLSLPTTINLPIMDILIKSILITQHFMIILIIRSHQYVWNAWQEFPPYRPRISQLVIYKLLNASKRPYHTTVMYVHLETNRTISTIVISFVFTH